MTFRCTCMFDCRPDPRRLSAVRLLKARQPVNPEPQDPMLVESRRRQEADNVCVKWDAKATRRERDTRFLVWMVSQSRELGPYEYDTAPH